MRSARAAIRVKLTASVAVHMVVRLVRTRRAAIWVGLVGLMILICGLAWGRGGTAVFRFTHEALLRRVRAFIIRIA